MCGDCTKWLVLRTRRKIGLLALSPEMITNALFPTATWCHVFFFFFFFFRFARCIYIYSSCGEYLIYCPSISGVSWYLWNYNAAGVSIQSIYSIRCNCMDDDDLENRRGKRNRNKQNKKVYRNFNVLLAVCAWFISDWWPQTSCVDITLFRYNVKDISSDGDIRLH